MRTPSQFSNYIEELTKDLVRTNRRVKIYKKISYHEAGHAFTELYYGIPPLLATLLPENNGGYIVPGYTSVKYIGPDDQIVTITNNHNVEKYISLTDKSLEVDPHCYYIVILLSGTLAEILFTDVYNKSAFSLDCYEIFLIYNEYFLMVYDEDVIRILVEHTLIILQNNWSNIQVIAQDLYKSKTLNQRYFEMAIKSTEITKVPPIKLNLKIDINTEEF